MYVKRNWPKPAILLLIIVWQTIFWANKIITFGFYDVYYILHFSYERVHLCFPLFANVSYWYLKIHIHELLYTHMLIHNYIIFSGVVDLVSSFYLYLILSHIHHMLSLIQSIVQLSDFSFVKQSTIEYLQENFLFISAILSMYYPWININT